MEINLNHHTHTQTHTHKGVTSFCHQEKIACFPLTSLYIPLLGDRGVNISYHDDCTSPSKLLLTSLVDHDRLEFVPANSEDKLAPVLCNSIIQGLSLHKVMVTLNSKGNVSHVKHFEGSCHIWTLKSLLMEKWVYKQWQAIMMCQHLLQVQ